MNNTANMLGVDSTDSQTLEIYKLGLARESEAEFKVRAEARLKKRQINDALMELALDPDYEPHTETGVKVHDAVIRIKNTYDEPEKTAKRIVLDHIEDALEELTVGYLPEKEHNQIEKEGVFLEDMYRLEELNWIPRGRSETIEEFRAINDAERTKRWLAERPTIKNQAFLLYVKIPLLGIDIDTTTMGWYYDKKTKRKKFDAERGTWRNWTEARIYVIGQIIKGNITRDEMEEVSGTRTRVNMSKKQRDACLRFILEKHGITLDQTVTEFTKNGGNSKPRATLIFSAMKDLSQPTRYSKSNEARTEVGSGKFREYIQENAGGVASAKPLTYWELEDAVINGYMDNEDMLERTFEAETNINEDEGDRSYDFTKMNESLAAYVGWAMRVKRFDLCDAALGIPIEKGVKNDNPEIVFDVECAEAVWNGEIHPTACQELFGNYWRDYKGDLRIGLWLQTAVTVLQPTYSNIETMMEQNEALVDRIDQLTLQSARVPESVIADEDAYERLKEDKPYLTGGNLRMINRKKARLYNEIEVNDGFIKLAQLVDTQGDMTPEEFTKKADKVRRELIKAQVDALSYRYGKKVVLGQNTNK